MTYDLINDKRQTTNDIWFDDRGKKDNDLESMHGKMIKAQGKTDDVIILSRDVKV